MYGLYFYLGVVYRMDMYIDIYSWVYIYIWGLGTFMFMIYKYLGGLCIEIGIMRVCVYVYGYIF